MIIRRAAPALAMLLLAGMLLAQPAGPAVTVEVVEAWPAGERVDEVRISIGDGSRHSREVLRHRVHIVADPDAAAAGPEPAWIEENRERNRERDRVDRERPQDEGGLLSSLFASAFVMAIPAIGIPGVLLPVLAWRRWSGGWRIAAALPLVAMGLMVLVILVGVAFDPTSHNLWPLTLMVIVFWGLVWIGALALLRRFSGRRRA